MEITAEQFTRIEHCLPTQRGNVSMSNLNVLNAILYVAEHGYKWRGLPQRYGNWHSIYVPHESLSQERRLGSGVCQAAARSTVDSVIFHWHSYFQNAVIIFSFRSKKLIECARTRQVPP